MVQSASMGPPLSPRETRRSGRRSAHSVSASASKSPDSDQPPPPPPQKERASTSRTTSSSAINRTKRHKVEEDEEIGDDRKLASASSVSSASTNGNGSGSKAKRKTNGATKDKDKDKSSNSSATAEDVETVTADDQPQDPAEDEEEQGVTRCVCGSSEDDPEAGEFMVQCEDCKVWQHGPCMGYQTEAQIPEDDYYCEQCRPDMHIELLKKLAKRPRQTSGTSVTSRVSRSHSPTQLLKQQTSKRRNTVNSAYDESLKEVLEATAAEAAGIDGPVSGGPDAVPAAEQETDNKKKRKRTEDDSASTKKRTRSASTTSDRHSVIATFVEPQPPEKPSAPQPPSKSTSASTAGGGGSKPKRAGRKNLAIEVAATESEEGTSTVTAPPPAPPPPVSKKSSTNTRTKAANAPKRPPMSQSVSASAAATLEAACAPTPPATNTRRTAGGGSTAAEARAYRQTHAYAVSQQTLYTSWNLPDYLSHLEQMLPSDTPQPLEVRAGGQVKAGVSVVANGASSGAVVDGGNEKMMERGVKVKWPAKRMSVVDMNKRVRALVEWVGREQASALDRGRRRDALGKALREHVDGKKPIRLDGEDVEMLDDTTADDDELDEDAAAAADSVSQEMSSGALEISAQTMRMMEELMEELIGFQERFGPGATKVRERERRGGIAVAQ
ncbi:hypothetical protein CPB83DRAFT_886565 [Crepidotus variabilis]|uniref:PHD-type domain-containing protein n=1 Tax=Crepidotus variabilis TaxID=179855 RepID=A0A9P6E7M7_9AGAR|nr:hypothetical protein CPB83DRAFT_886565 [Crepidotus variabilis]